MWTRVEKILAQVQTAGVEQAEVTLAHKKLTEMQIDAGHISLMRNTDNHTLSIRGLHESRYASITLNQLDERDVQDGIRALKSALASAPPDPARQLAPGGKPLEFRHGPEAADLEAMYSQVDQFNQTVANRYPEIQLEQSTLDHTSAQTWTLNSNGLRAEQRKGIYSFGAMFSAKRGNKVSSFSFSGAAANDLKNPLLNWGMIESNMQSSIREIDHQPLTETFNGAMVISPEAIGDFLWPWLDHISDQLLIAGTSCLRDQMNQSAMSPLITLRAEPRHPELANHEFLTAEGFASEPSVIVERGALKSWLLSDYGARKTGLERAKNSGANLVMEAGQTPKAELVKDIQLGLWLGRFSGGHPAANGDFSGVAKSSYLIRGGKIAEPIAEVMISGNIFALFNSVRRLSQERLNNGSSLLPWLVVDGIHVAGK